MSIIEQFILGVILSGLIGALAYRRKSLSASGVVGAMLVGTTIFGFGGWTWGMLLIVFFVLSSLLSKYKASVKAQLAVEKFDKGSQRDFGQTIANGGVGALMALLYGLWAHPALFCGFVGAMATVNADTWATELGVLSKSPPRLITTTEIVETGRSGGISLVGTLAALAGCVVIGLSAWGLLLIEAWLGQNGATFPAGASLESLMWLVGVAIVGGMAGALFDSLLGATVQVIYYDSERNTETERARSRDGQPNQPLRGWLWMNNDMVNLVSSLVGAWVAWFLIIAGHSHN
ncbi:DUF92 domain-containing protein [Anaerolineales bacterium HSG25]|nr:DUF92 domain-containing protein [Anaerolineales bacterium HSG25]